MVNRLFTAWLRSACALFGIAGILLLTGCGGGSGAPNNPYEPPPPVIPRPARCCPRALTVYPGTPADADDLRRRAAVPGLHDERHGAAGRRPPSPATRSCWPPITVSDTTTVSITVQDARRHDLAATAVVTVSPAPLLPSRHDRSPATPTRPATTTDNTVCSGGTGTATVQGDAATAASASRAGRSASTSCRARSRSSRPTRRSRWSQTLTVVTRRATATRSSFSRCRPTRRRRSGIIRVTDVTTGQQITGNFLIQQVDHRRRGARGPADRHHDDHGPRQHALLVGRDA